MTASPTKQKGRLPWLRWLRNGRYGIVLGVATLIFLGVSGAITDWFLRRDTTKKWEGIAHDLRFRIRGDLPRSPKVVIVGVTSTSLDQKDLAPLAGTSEAVRLMHDNVWPWPRSIHARVIERLFEAGAKVVAVDIAMPSARPGDDELVAVLKKYEGRVVLATIIQQAPDSVGHVVTIVPPHSRFVEAAGPSSQGLAKFILGVDSVVRRFNFRSSELRELGLDDDARDLPHFAVQAVEIFTGQRAPDRYDEILNFTGPPHTYEYLPVEEIFNEARYTSTDRRFEGGAVFRDKIVFYGPIAEIMHDVHSTPFGIMAGVEIHAQLAGSVLAKRFIPTAPAWASVLLSFLSTVGSGLLVLRLRNPAFQTISLGVLLALVFTATQLAFSHGHILFPTVPWLVGGVAAGAFSIVFLYFLEQRDRTQTLRLLERSINKRIAAVMLRNPDEIAQARRGERRKVAVLFTDIRNFTAWSEKATPEQLVGQLNEYFEAMVPLVEDTFGNAQKFIGDAILSAWGDVAENDFGEAENSARAITAALRMRVKLRELNVTWDRRPDRIVISIGMGIHHGEVIAGTVGHPERIEYTVLGDGVNFAARLESATKQFHADCLVGESVEALTRERFVFRQVGNLRVKGKTKPVRIFTPLSEVQTPPPEWLADYHRAIALHDARQFAEAVALFRDVKRRAGGEDFLCDWYVEKCEAFIASPPPEEWDGSHTLAEK